MVFEEVTYTPLLSVRPAEMQALEELPFAARQYVLPYITLRRWTSAHRFENTISRIEACTQSRPTIVDITDEGTPAKNVRTVHRQIDALRDPKDGYKNWVRFIEQHPYAIPSVQLAIPAEVPAQITALSELGRGIVFRLNPPSFPIARDIARQVSESSNGVECYFIIDLQQQDESIFDWSTQVFRVLTSIRNELPTAFLSVSATSFPMSFVDIAEQQIYERAFYNFLIDEFGGERMIYSDWGSTRAEKQEGGGGAVPPRIDNSFSTKWEFFRVAEDGQDRQEAYRQAAIAATASDTWIDRDVWGTNQIEKISEENSGILTSTKLATAIRINTHIVAQCESLSPEGPVDAEDVEWID